MSKINHSPKDNLNSRITFFKIFLGLFAALIVLRLFVISVGRHSLYVAQAQNQHSRFQKINATRGDILVTDRYSDKPYPVATNAHKDLAYIVPPDIKDANATAESLAKILNLDSAAILPKFTDKTKKYVVIKRMLSDEESKTVSDAKLAGVYLDQEDVRLYPQGDFMSQVLGFLGYKDGADQKVGLYGIERYMQKDLAGTQGEIYSDTDKNGNVILGSQKEFTPAIDGSTLELTIDRSIQFKVEQVLKDTVSKHGADSGSVIVADPKTGAILAMANYPSFDPNEYNKVTDVSVFNNLAVTENYEPGSTMKAITIASAIDAGLISPQTTYNDTGVVEIAGYKIKNSDGKAHGIVPMTTVLDESLNTGAIWVENQIGNDKYLEDLKRFGFGAPTNVELSENVGNLSNLKGNIQINFDTASFGQGITVTPLQMLQSYMPLANKGKLEQLHLVAKTILPDGTVKEFKPQEKQVVSEKTAQLVSSMLVDVVENGHGKKAAVPGYYIGGKTGTAQVASGGTYIQNDNIGSFLGYGPIEDPRFVMLVFVNHPRDVKFAESTAAPAFGEIAQFILNYYNVPTTRH